MRALSLQSPSFLVWFYLTLSSVLAALAPQTQSVPSTTASTDCYAHSEQSQDFCLSFKLIYLLKTNIINGV